MTIVITVDSNTLLIMIR